MLTPGLERVVAGDLRDVVGPQEHEVVPRSRIRGVVDRGEALQRDVRNLVRIELRAREQVRIVDADLAVRRIQERVDAARAVVAVALAEVLRRAGRAPRERELVDERVGQRARERRRQRAARDSPRSSSTPLSGSGSFQTFGAHVCRTASAMVGRGTKSILMLSFRWLLKTAGLPIQLFAPCWNPGIGSGYALSSARPCGLMRSCGMMLPGNGRPVSGSRMTRPGRSALKSPLRIAAVGTMPVCSSTVRSRCHSWPQKKNS